MYLLPSALKTFCFNRLAYHTLETNFKNSKFVAKTNRSAVNQGPRTMGGFDSCLKCQQISWHCLFKALLARGTASLKHC